MPTAEHSKPGVPSKSACKAMALADLARQKDTLTAHLAQARFAVAAV